MKNTVKLVLWKSAPRGTDLPEYGKKIATCPTMAATTSATMDRLPIARVGSLGNLQMTTSFPGIGVPAAGCKKDNIKLQTCLEEIHKNDSVWCCVEFIILYEEQKSTTISAHNRVKAWLFYFPQWHQARMPESRRRKRWEKSVLAKTEPLLLQNTWIAHWDQENR